MNTKCFSKFSIYLIAFLFIGVSFSLSVRSEDIIEEKSYTPVPRHVDLSAHDPIVSGLSKDEILTKGKAIITVGFKLPHAYLACEYKEGTSIGVQGIHFGGTDCCFNYYQGRITLCTPSKSEVMLDDRNLVLSKFCGAIERKKRSNGLKLLSDESKEVPAIYTKFRSFVIDHSKLEDLFKSIPKIRKEVSFSIIGDVFFANDHNCCSFEAMLLRKVGIDVRIPGLYVRGPENLKYYIKKYEEDPSSPRHIVTKIKKH